MFPCPQHKSRRADSYGPQARRSSGRHNHTTVAPRLPPLSSPYVHIRNSTITSRQVTNQERLTYPPAFDNSCYLEGLQYVKKLIPGVRNGALQEVLEGTIVGLEEVSQRLLELVSDLVGVPGGGGFSLASVVS